MTSLLLEQLQLKHLAVWTERDAAKRLDLMAQIYDDTIQLFDKEFTLNGNQEISDFIAKLHSGEYFDFHAAQPIEATQQGARLFWTIQTKATGEPMTGMDFFIVENEKVTQLYVFIDGQK